MKILAVLMFVAVFNVSASTYAQNKKITLNLSNSSIKEVFNQIEKQSEFTIFYKSNDVDLNKTINVRAKDRYISNILDDILHDSNLTYTVKDKVIVVYPRQLRGSIESQQQEQQKPVVNGLVTDLRGEPIIGASVTVKGTTQGVITNENGKYSIEIPNKNSVLVFSFVGMKTQEITVKSSRALNIILADEKFELQEVVAVGYGTQKKASLTGAISNISSKDLDRVHGATASAELAGKIAGLSFRQTDGRPGSSAAIQIRNMGDPLYIIDGITKDAGQFNNISPNDIESISVLKDASAAIYGVRAANGVVVVTTKRGKLGSKNVINVDAYTGWQNWTRFPKTVNAYEWMLGKADAEMNQYGQTAITPDELAKWKAGTEYGYKSFDWYKLIIQPNTPQTSINVNATGGSENVNYYFSVTRLDQNSVLGREFTFGRTNIQSNIEAKVARNLKVGMQINGRIESRDNPGVPGGDDYWAPRFALFRNRPTERPFANDNPEYLNDIGHNDTNWGLLNIAKSGHYHEDWRVIQTNFNAEYQLPIKGLTAKGMYSYYLADRLMNNQEYTYDAYTYNPNTQVYTRTGGSSNPWQERGTHKVIETVGQGQLNYNNTFGKHTIGATFVAERVNRQELDVWVHDVPTTNALSIIKFANMDTYNDNSWEEARIGYIGRINYNYDNRYYLEVAGRRDGSSKFAPDKRWGFFPSASAGWRVSNEGFFKSLTNLSAIVTDLKLRASYGKLGDDNNGIGASDFTYVTGYNYAASTNILDGTVVSGSRDRGPAVKNISWYISRMSNIGADYTLYDGKITGTLDFFQRKRTGLRGRKYDVIVPNELGYTLPDENVNSDEQRGGEIAIAYNGKIRDISYTIGGNASYSRNKFLSSYKPKFSNSWDYYRNSGEDRYTGIYWGYQAIGQFKSYDEINNYKINIDGQGNKTLRPGDFIYKDVNGDGSINQFDERPIGYATGQPPIINLGINLAASWKGIDFHADFSGGTTYSYSRNWEMRWPYQNTGNLLANFYDSRWHRVDPYDINSAWIPGKYPALTFNDGGNSNFNKSSTFWLTNVKYLRARTIEVGYTLPKAWLDKINLQKVRLFVNGYNLFSIDNLKDAGIDPEVADENGLQYPQSSFVNIGVNLTF
ncbi:MAG: TonB-dependent receptor [Bacteroidota bacterium]|nr:TonB-dependent receptor [Bacteroidota bacterium]